MSRLIELNKKELWYLWGCLNTVDILTTNNIQKLKGYKSDRLNILTEISRLESELKLNKSITEKIR